MAAPALSVQVEENTALHSETGVLVAIAGMHVVVADYDSALTIARLLKRDAFARRPSTTRIMIVTPRDGEADVRRALECGVQGYLPLDSKPADVIDGVVALHRGQRVLGRIVAQRVAESFDHEALTIREVDVLRFVVAGDANKTVAKKLNIALGTVKVHVRSIMGKLGARTRTEAAAVARRRGLVEREPEIDTVPAPLPHWLQRESREGSVPAGPFPPLRVVHQR
jgi:DNA-binding NarL/FixJ family response regulator